MIKLELQCEFAEVRRGVPVVHKVRTNLGQNLELLADLVAILASEIELARVQKRGIEHARGLTPIVRLPGA